MKIWVQDSLITPQRDPMDVGFDAAPAFLTPDHRFSVGLRSGDFGVVPKPFLCLLAGMFGVIILLEDLHERNFILCERYHNGIHDIHVYVLIHDGLDPMYRAYSVIGKASPYHTANFFA